MRSDTDRLLGTVETGAEGRRAGTAPPRPADRAHRAASAGRRVHRKPCLQPSQAGPPEKSSSHPFPAMCRSFSCSAMPEDLRTAILNLIDNAVKYSPNGVHIRCRVGIERYTWATLSITDTGVGLLPTRAQAGLQALLPRLRERPRKDQGHGSRPVPGPHDRATARRRSSGSQRGARPGHDDVPCNCRWLLGASQMMRAQTAHRAGGR